MKKLKEVEKILYGYIEHWQLAGNDCDCAICSAQENGTYIDGLVQAIDIINSKTKK